MVRAAKRKVHRFHRAEKVLASMPAQAAQTQRSTIAGDAPHALTLAATSLGFVVVQLGVAIVNVALQRIGDAMGSGIAGLQWMVNAYTVVFASLVLTAGQSVTGSARSACSRPALASLLSPRLPAASR
jgi:hypothetical protein